jgi:nitrilase
MAAQPTISEPFIVAAVQAAPVFLDRAATLEKACDLIAQAGREGARLVAFPESFIPAYPDWVWALPPGEARLHDELYAELLANAVDIPGPETARLGQAARQAGVLVAIGLTERNREASGSSLYNSLLYLDAQGNLLGAHRKLVPTGGERLVWAQGDGSTLQVFDTPLGRLGGLICWENYMPLARYALYAWGIHIYVAATWDRGEVWLASLRHIAREGGVAVIGCGMALRRDDIPDRFEFKRYYQGPEAWINTGDSAILGPEGEFLAGPLREQEGLLFARVDPARLRGSRRMLDVAGHYGRPDVFQLTVQRKENPAIREAAPEADPAAGMDAA